MGRSTIKLGLVVLGITVVVMPVLFNFFAHAREKAQERKCIANLHSIAEAIKMYEEDYDAIMPWGSGGRSEEHWATGTCTWSDLAEDYVKAVWDNGSNYEDGMSVLLNCPSAPYPSDQRKTYGYNRYLGNMKRARNPLTVLPVTIRYPALTIRVTETCRPEPNAFPDILDSHIEGTFAPVPDWKAAGLSGPVLAPGWHHGRNNVLWVDGHVSTMSKEEVMLTDSSPDPNVWARLSPKPQSAK